MAAGSIIAVLVTGNLLGALIKGITGFGSAIINLSVWIIATCAGINSGTLQQAVLTECIASEVLAIPLLLMTRAHATCDWALVLSLCIFGAIGAPIGAAMLTHLPARQVEFAVGCLMLLVILLNCLRKKASAQGTEQQAGCATKELADSLPAHMPELEHEWSLSAGCAAGQQKQVHADACSIELPLVVVQEAHSPVDELSIQHCFTLTADSTGDLPAGQASPVQRRSTSRGSSSSSLASDVQCVCIISPDQPCDTDMEDVALLSSTGAAKQPLSDCQVDANGGCQPQVGAASCCQGAGCSLKSRMLCWWSTVTQPDRLAILHKMLMMGSIAGTASGIMAGLTGMGGPPIMLMFERLQISKDSVRGTNAVCNIIQIRIFAYLAMGVFSRADIDLYIAVSAAAVVGMFLGCMAAARTNQATFSRMLTALMVLCCVLMFASAAGVAGNSAGHSTS